MNFECFEFEGFTNLHSLHKIHYRYPFIKLRFLYLPIINIVFYIVLLLELDNYFKMNIYEHCTLYIDTMIKYKY